MALCTSSSGGAQQPSTSTALRAPILTLVQPPAGGNVPNDRPTVFFRYAPGDASDPIDDASFQVWMDGAERTAGFRAGNGEAWGTLSPSGGTGRDAREAGGRGSGGGTAKLIPLTAGAHLVIARVCSVRGICSATKDVVVAVPTAALPPDGNLAALSRRSGADSAGARRHNHLKQPLTLIGDLASNIAKLFRH